MNWTSDQSSMISNQYRLCLKDTSSHIFHHSRWKAQHKFAFFAQNRYFFAQKQRTNDL